MHRPVLHTLMIGLLSLSAWHVCPAAPAQWEQVLSDGQSSYYLDTASIKTEGRVRTFWTLRDYKTTQATYDGKAYQSALLRMALDCSGQEATALEISYFTGRMLGGDKVLRESDFHNAQPVQSGSPINRFAQRLCK